ncbi:MAG: hypothetical protein DRG78_00740 [Epsilonproteobacteria bacterium]|nr:MAG: hypothetical protein DRG78_00740 [Campylobacterota bacterium]
MLHRRIFLKIVLVVGTQLLALTPVSDAMSYQYLINNINQTTQLIEGVTTQIEALGGIRTVMNEVKSDINDAKSSLQGSMSALEGSGKRFNKSINNVEVKSLFDMDETGNSSSGDGIAYTEVAKIFTDAFVKADNALISSLGGKDKFDNFSGERNKLIAALNTNSIADFNAIMSKPYSKKDYIDKKRTMLVEDYIKEYKSMILDSQQITSAQTINNEWKAELFPTSEEELQKKEDDKNRMNDLIKFINNAKDMKQSAKTTNILLLELLQLQQKNYKSALNYRNAMTSLFLKNGDNKNILKELKKRQVEMKKLENNEYYTPRKLRNSRRNKMKGANPYGIGFKPLS